MDEEDWFSKYVKPFDPSSEGTEEDGSKEGKPQEKRSTRKTGSKDA